MDSPTLLCIDLPQVLELRKETLESHGYSVKLASSRHTAMKMLEESLVAAVLLEYKHEDSEAIACHIKQRFPNVPIILLSAYFDMPEQLLWLVDEYVMKSELQAQLVPIIERAHTSSHYVLANGTGVGGQKHSRLDLQPDLSCVIAVAPCAE
jgi:CheY-like chemotaxis protein